MTDTVHFWIVALVVNANTVWNVNAKVVTNAITLASVSAKVANAAIVDLFVA